MSDIAISVRGLVKEYEVYTKPVDLALEVLTRRKRHTIFRALDGVSFDVPRGEVLGIIGSNGAGKSTLLKVITGVLEPSSGTVDIKGRVTAILELGLGFNPEYSGRENIYLSGLLYGMNRAEIDSKIEEIIEFSGLAEFIERPVKTYSSGMHSRLAFSIATAVEPDILIIDEALAAGDSTFVQKCLRRIRQLCSGGRTVLLVSHGTGLLAQLCQRVIWMERGKIRMVGPAISVVQAYDLTAHQQADSASWIETVEDDLDVAVTQLSPEQTRALQDGRENAGNRQDHSKSKSSLRELFDAGSDGARHVFRRGPVYIDSVEMLDSEGNLTSRLTMLKPFTLKIHYHVEGDIPAETLGVALSVNGKYDLSSVAQFFTQNIRPFETRETYDTSIDRQRPSRVGTLVLSYDYVPFRKGEYFLSLGLVPNVPGTWEFYEYRHFYYTFSVDDAGMDVGAPVFFSPAITYEGEPRPKVAAVSVPLAAEKKPVIPPRKTGVALPAGLTTLRAEIESICIEHGGYPEAWPRHAHCPACLGGPLGDAFSKYGFSHVRCGACGFVCVDPYPTDEIMTELYQGAYYSQTRELYEWPLLANGGEGTPYSAPREVLEAIITRTTTGMDRGHWLDVGGGLGAFANLVQQMRPNWVVKLNELNPQSIRIARELFDFEVVPSDPQELLQQNEQFDVVSSVAVLEHIPEPFAFLESYARLVKPGGWLVTAVPHFSNLNAELSHGSSANVVPPYHVSLFNEEAFRRLMSRLPGFELVSIDQAGPAAFELIHYPQTGENWDISIPDDANPEPKSMQITPYSYEMQVQLNVLDDVGHKLANFFAEKDGRLYLIAYCRRNPA